MTAASALPPQSEPCRRNIACHVLPRAARRIRQSPSRARRDADARAPQAGDDPAPLSSGISAALSSGQERKIKNICCRPQIEFGMVEENAGEKKLIMQKVSKGMTIHIPAGEHP